jgi:hypothetical protein
MIMLGEKARFIKFAGGDYDFFAKGGCGQRGEGKR